MLESGSTHDTCMYTLYDIMSSVKQPPSVFFFLASEGRVPIALVQRGKHSRARGRHNRRARSEHASHTLFLARTHTHTSARRNVQAILLSCNAAHEPRLLKKKPVQKKNATRYSVFYYYFLLFSSLQQYCCRIRSTNLTGKIEGFRRRLNDDRSFESPCTTATYATNPLPTCFATILQTIDMNEEKGLSNNPPVSVTR